MKADDFRHFCYWPKSAFANLQNCNTTVAVVYWPLLYFFVIKVGFGHGFATWRTAQSDA